MIRRPPRSTLSSSSAASDVYKRQVLYQPQPDQHHADHRVGAFVAGILRRSVVGLGIRLGGQPGYHHDTEHRDTDHLCRTDHRVRPVMTTSLLETGVPSAHTDKPPATRSMRAIGPTAPVAVTAAHCADEALALLAGHLAAIDEACSR